MSCRRSTRQRFRDISAERASTPAVARLNIHDRPITRARLDRPTARPLACPPVRRIASVVQLMVHGIGRRMTDRVHETGRHEQLVSLITMSTCDAIRAAWARRVGYHCRSPYTAFMSANRMLLLLLLCMCVCVCVHVCTSLARLHNEFCFSSIEQFMRVFAVASNVKAIVRFVVFSKFSSYMADRII